MDIVVRLLNGLLMIIVPILLGIFIARRLGQRWLYFVGGVVLFVGSQLLHIPFNLVILRPILDQLGFGDGVLGIELIAAGALVGLSAGVFEEVTRWLGLRYWLKEARSWGASLMYGAGWGGIEAILLGLGVLLFLVQALLFRQGSLQSLIPPEQLGLVQAQFDTYWETPLLVNLLGAAERVFALILHLSLSVLVMRVFTRKNRLWLLAAVAWHAFVDAVAVIAISQIGVVETEALVAGMAAISLAIIFYLREHEPPEEDLPPPAQEVDYEPAPVRVTEEKVDESRYAS